MGEPSPEQVFDELCEIDLAERELTVVVCASREKGESPFPDLRRLEAMPKLKETFLGIVHKHIQLYAKRRKHPLFRLQPYDEGVRDAKHLVEWDKPEGLKTRYNVGHLLDCFEPDDDGMNTELHRFDHNDSDFIDQMYYYGVVFRDEDEQTIYALREYASRYEVQRSSRWYMFQRDGNEFDLYQKSMFSFDGYIDVVIYKGYAFVFKRKGFRKIFDYEAVVKSLAEETLEAIGEANLITNLGAFRDAVMVWPTMRQKLANMSRGESLKGVDVASVQVQLTDVGLEGEVRLADDGRIDFNSEEADLQTTWRILNLLDSSIFRSKLNNRVYISSGKRGMK